VGRFDRFAPRQRVCRSRALRGRAHLDHCAGQLRAVGSGLVLQQRRAHRAGQLRGRVGAFLAELSFQLFGYASYLIPA